MDEKKIVHSSLQCEKLKRTAASKVLTWCGICVFGGLGAASNMREGYGQPSSSSTPTPYANTTPEADAADAAEEHETEEAASE
jgi:hypothetical protein